VIQKIAFLHYIVNFYFKVNIAMYRMSEHDFKKKVIEKGRTYTEIFSAKSSKKAGKKPDATGISPQKILYSAVSRHIPDAEWEREDLIPGRKFRADIYIPASKIILEMDGFKFHKSKAAFQADRKRQNILTEHGYVVLRFFTGQILNSSSLDEAVILILNTHNKHISN
jgi:very-short-patch-repair endonuclease